LRGDPRLEIGGVARAHGIRGEVVVVTHDPDSAVLGDGARIYVAGVERTVERARSTQKGWLVKLAGVAAAADIPVGQHDLRGKRGRRQDLGNQRVGIKRNRPEQLVKLVITQRLIGGRRGWHLGRQGHDRAGEHTQ